MNRGLIFHAPWAIALESRPLGDGPGPSEVLVRVRATGVCGTDIGIIRGDYNARPGVMIGHESAGEIEAIGRDVRSVAVGDRVTIDPTYYCGHCKMCRTQRPNHCEEKAHREAGVTIDGTFGHYYRADERFVHPIADHVGFDEASMTEPLSCVLTGLNQLRLRADMETVIAGAGPMGMLYCFALAAHGFVGTVMEKSEDRLALCQDVLPPGWLASPPIETREASLDLIIDTTGQALPWGLRGLRRGGQFLAVGLTSPACAVRPSELADRSLSIVGSIDSIGTFALASRMIETGAIPAWKLISHQLPLDHYREGFSLLGLDLGNRCRPFEAIRAMKVILTS